MFSWGGAGLPGLVAADPHRAGTLTCTGDITSLFFYKYY